MIVKKCPHKNCNNNIRLHKVKFPVINDYGGIVVKCDECQNLSYTEMINRVEASISKGAEKIDTWDNDHQSKEEFISNFGNILELEQGILVTGDLDFREYEFNFSAPHIHFCKECGQEIETISRSALMNEGDMISETFLTLMNYSLATTGLDYDDLLIEVEAQCKCGHNFTSYWYSSFVANHKPIDLENDVYFIGSDMPLNPDSIDGIMSKNDCKTVLEKFIIRWNVIYPKLLIVTPFVGHQFLSKEETIELWEWIKNFLDPEKSTLVTRTATFNKYKAACEEKGISITLLEQYGLNNQIIQDFTKKQDFHAKIYVGYSDTEAEIIMGSFNLMNGPSVENIAFKKIDYKTFTDKFITPMKISLPEPGKLNHTWFHIKKMKDSWGANSIEINTILDILSNGRN